MKKVLLISHSSNYGGGEAVFIKITESLSKKCEVIVVFPNENGILHERVKGYKKKYCLKYYNLSESSTFKNIIKLLLNIKALFNLLKIIKKEKIDIVYSNTSVTIIGIISAILTRKQHVWHIHEIQNYNLLFFKLYEILFNYKEGQLVFVSETLLKNWQKRIKFRKNNFKIIYNPVTKYNIGEKNTENFSFGFAGTLNRNKNICFLIQAFKKLKEIHSDTELIIAGQGELFDIVKQSAIEGIEIMGQVEDMSDFYNKIDVLVVPSLNDSFSLVAAEAMLLGKVVIINENVGIKEIIENNVNGLIYRNNDNNSLFKSMERLHSDIWFYSKLSEESKKTAGDCFKKYIFEQKIERLIFD